MSNDSRSSNGGQGTATPGNMEELFNDSISSLYSQFSNQSGTERQVLRTSSLNIPRTVTTTEDEQRGGDDPMDEQQGGNSRQRRRRRNSAPINPLSHGGSSSDASTTRLVSPSSGGSNRDNETSSRSLPYESSVPILYLLDAIGRDALSGEQKRSSLRHMLTEALDTLDLDGDDLLG